MLVHHGGGTLVPCQEHAGTRHGLRVAGTGPMPLADRAEVNSYHDFAIGELGPDLEAVARAADGSVEAVVHRQLPIWGVMWHPERAPRDEGDARLLRRSSGRRRA